MDKPVIRTALPKRRYKLGDFTAVVLGDIDSGDQTEYFYVMGVVRDGEAEPGMYITSERNRAAASGEGSAVMRVVMRDGSQPLGASDRWADLDLFANDALETLRQVLGLGAEEPYRLM